MRRRRGITLVELLVTVTILGAVAPGIILASGTAARLGRTTQKRAAARGLLIRQIELFRQMCRLSTITTGTTSTTTEVPKVGAFAVSRVVSKANGLGACEVTVTWSDTRGKGLITDSVRMGTMMREGD